MSFDDLLATLDGLGHPRVLVLGDLILDRYTWGNAERVSQEAPVILLRADHREARLGGAANVCQMLRGLEAEVGCAGVVGGDAEGELVRGLLANLGVDVAELLTDPARPTTVKERFIGRAQGRHPHQMLRVDSEVREAIERELEERLATAIGQKVADYEVLLVSDYGKGVCTPRLIRTVIDAARQADVPVLVDPIRSNDYSRYRGATSMTPNRLEAELATGFKIVTAEDAFRAGRKLIDDLGLDMAIVTLDRDGMALVYADGRGQVYPTRPRAVYDITGAGDMALAMIGVCLGAGIGAPKALRLGNVAAGLEVEKVGVAVIPREEIRGRLVEEQAAVDRSSARPLVSGSAGGRGGAPAGRAKVLSLDELVQAVAAHRLAGRKVVFTNGCFDLLHVGHVSYLAEAKALGDVLVVAVNSDASVRRLKGPTRPVIRQADRAALLAALAAVDYVLIFHEDTPRAVLEQIKPDVLVKGGTYSAAEVVGHDLVLGYGGRVEVMGLVEGISTTNILASLAGQQAMKGPHFQAERQPASAGGKAR